METIIYKGVEIQKIENWNFVFYLDGTKYMNTSLHFAKVMISRELKNNPKPQNPKPLNPQAMNNKPQTLSPADLLCKFVDGRPGIEPVNYGSWKDYRRESAEVTRDRRDFYELFIFALRKVQDLDAKIEKYLKTTSDRLTFNEAGELRYITGQYFPTEYRPAASRVLVSVIWNDTRETMPHLKTGHEIRAYLRRQFSRRLNSNYFN